ncbi:MAG: DUF2975 domain-containing protein [Oscillospiraceae bacterium]|nr:DUF2975 domain-containing protein [Oscillospiraceae bacterium]
MDKNVKKLKHKIYGDSVISWVFAFDSFINALTRFLSYANNGHSEKTLREAGFCTLAFIVLTLIGFILHEVKTSSRPFTKKLVWEMRILGVTLAAGAFLPDLLCLIMGLINNNTSEVTLFSADSGAGIIFICGIVTEIFSEIFVYGNQLQDDNDLIA